MISLEVFLCLSLGMIMRAAANAILMQLGLLSSLVPKLSLLLLVQPLSSTHMGLFYHSYGRVNFAKTFRPTLMLSLPLLMLLLLQRQQKQQEHSVHSGDDTHLTGKHTYSTLTTR